MGIFSKIKEITQSSHFSICQIEEGEIAIDLWDLNQTYTIDLNDNNKVYFDTTHSDSCTDFEFAQNFLEFLEKNKGDII